MLIIVHMDDNIMFSCAQEYSKSASHIGTTHFNAKKFLIHTIYLYVP
jgi:hypothetical protein